jgi:hypothetical protein
LTSPAALSPFFDAFVHLSYAPPLSHHLLLGVRAGTGSIACSMEGPTRSAMRPTRPRCCWRPSPTAIHWVLCTGISSQRTCCAWVLDMLTSSSPILAFQQWCAFNLALVFYLFFSECFRSQAPRTLLVLNIKSYSLHPTPAAAGPHSSAGSSGEVLCCRGALISLCGDIILHVRRRDLSAVD